jgi:hypothetical protein
MWLLRVPAIRQELTSIQVPVLDRPMFEKLFRVKRRRAIQLMHYFGAYQTGQAMLIDRGALMIQLEALEAGTEFAIEHGRKQRLIDSLERARKLQAAAAVRIPVARESIGRSIVSLPDGVSLESGRLQVAFGGAEDLLAKLYAFARTAANDFEAFREIVNGTAA